MRAHLCRHSRHLCTAGDATGDVHEAMEAALMSMDQERCSGCSQAIPAMPMQATDTSMFPAGPSTSCTDKIQSISHSLSCDDSMASAVSPLCAAIRMHQDSPWIVSQVVHPAMPVRQEFAKDVERTGTHDFRSGLQRPSEQEEAVQVSFDH